jgi:hypothetical protein
VAWWNFAYLPALYGDERLGGERSRQPAEIMLALREDVISDVLSRKEARAAYEESMKHVNDPIVIPQNVLPLAKGGR